MIKTKKIEFSYDNEFIFKFEDISLTNEENLLILGNSGIGKTTLLHLLSGPYFNWNESYYWQTVCL